MPKEDPERYLQHHGLVDFAESLIAEVQEEQPEDPYEYIIRRAVAMRLMQVYLPRPKAITAPLLSRHSVAGFDQLFPLQLSSIPGPSLLNVHIWQSGNLKQLAAEILTCKQLHLKLLVPQLLTVLLECRRPLQPNVKGIQETLHQSAAASPLPV